MGKVGKVVKAVGKATTGAIDTATQKDGNNLLLLILIVIVWLYLFFSKENGK